MNFWQMMQRADYEVGAISSILRSIGECGCDACARHYWLTLGVKRFTRQVVMSDVVSLNIEMREAV